MKIGQTVLSIEFSENERARIAAALQDPSSRQRAVINDKAPQIRDQEFWASAQKRFEITGFRPGNATAKQIVVRRALDDVRRHNGGYRIWSLYRRCVSEYVNADLGELSELLLKEDFVEGEGSLTEQIIRSIAEKIPLYDATASQVFELYELWGFDRSDRVEKILSAPGTDISLVKELIARERRDLLQELDQRAGRIAQDGAARDGRFVSDVGTLREELQDVRAEILTDLAATKERLALALARLEEITRKRKGGDAPLRTVVDNSVLEKLSGELERVRATVNRHDRKLADLGQTSATSAVSRKSGSNETWAQLLSRCRQACADAGFPGASFAALRLFIELMRRARVVVCSRATFPLKVLEAVYEIESRQIAASPLWTGAKDWHDALTFISTRGSRSRALVLLDFDVAVQEAYLVPSLREWMASSGDVDNWMILVTAGPDIGDASSRVLELAVVVSNDTSLLAELTRSTEGINVEEAPEWKNTVGTGALRPLESANREYERQICQLASNCGAELPLELVARFVSIADGLSRTLQRSESIRIASGITLLPWIRVARSDGVARIFEETLRTLFWNA